MKKLTFRGDTFTIGKQLGQAGHTAWHQELTLTPLWQTVTALKDSAQAQVMAAAVKQHYPDIWLEIEGLACGLEADTDEVFAWNCRGDLVRSTSDGCTTLAGRNEHDDIVIAHNEDGFPQLRDACFLAEVIPDQGVSYLSFAYPGSLCGHTFSVNQYGIVNTVNNIRAIERPEGLPRQVLARAALNAVSLDQAVAVLTSPDRAGAFHHMLASAGDSRIFSIEATGTGCSILPLKVSTGHANHLVHPQQQATEQVITDSSAARQQVIEALLATDETLSAKRSLMILSDQSQEALPVYRLAADDPDQENTLATALFELSDEGVSWSVYGKDRQQPVLKGNILRGSATI
ncbi:C45 family autoproteolytic acyltransferase/hydolase [Tatumella ptyseos]|uniref:C45 family autoproteolytic acyltransferase/hydolase n=1 Tax=Tatumella ptyseos TaxID=82987 RepID=UPI0023F47CF5|nr:C45 family peptidase [Tatumella ptyseos]